jgi:hypothetical protein
MITITCSCGATLTTSHYIAQQPVAIEDVSEYTVIRLWTSKEDAQLKRLIKKKPENLLDCFTEIAKKQNRRVKEVSSRWYQVLRYEEPLFYLDDNSVQIPNMKNKIRKKRCIQ